MKCEILLITKAACETIIPHISPELTLRLHVSHLKEALSVERCGRTRSIRRLRLQGPSLVSTFASIINGRARVLLTVSIFGGVSLMPLVWHPVDALPTIHEGVADHLGRNLGRSGRDRLRLFSVSGEVQGPVART